MRYLPSASIAAAILLTACTATSQAGSQPSTPTSEPATTVAASSTAARPPVDPLTVPVPAMCEQPAGTLVDGSLPDPVNNGFVSVQQEFVESGDLVGDATLETVVPIACSAGGIGWPQTIHVFAPGPVQLVQINLSDYNPDGIVALIESVEIVDKAIVVQWMTDAPGDPTCCPTIRVEGHFTLSVTAGGEITVLDGSLPGVTTTVAASVSSAPASGAVDRLQQYFRAMGIGDSAAFCAIGAPGYEAEGMPQEDCLALFDTIRSSTPEDELASMAEAVVDPALAVQVAPDRVEIPGTAVTFPTLISEPPAAEDVFVMGFDGTDWFIVEYRP